MAEQPNQSVDDSLGDCDYLDHHFDPHGFHIYRALLQYRSASGGQNQGESVAGSENSVVKVWHEEHCNVHNADMGRC